MAISYNTGTTSTVTSSGTAGGHTFTIPAGVLSGDTILVLVFCFTTATGTIVPTLSSSATTPVQLSSSPQTAAGGGIIAVSGVWSIAAGASDPSATLTFGATGGSGGSYWYDVGLVSYTGAGGVDVSAGTEFYTASGPGTTTTPSVNTVAASDWQVQLLGVAPPNGADLSGGSAPSGLSLRQNIGPGTNAGLLLKIADSNGSVGGAGTTIGNTTWTGAGAANNNVWSTSFTVGLQPPASVAPPQQQAIRASRYPVRRQVPQPAAPPPPSAPAAISSGKVAKAPPRKPPSGYGKGQYGTRSQAVAGVTGSITVTGIAGSITAVTGSPGQVVKARPAPRPGRWRASPGTLGVTIAGVSGSITVTGIAGNVTAVTGSPGQVIKARTVAKPARGQARGLSAGTLGITIAGVSGSITVTGLSGSVQAVTGSPGQVARARPVPKPGRWRASRGTLSVAVAGVTGSITVTSVAGSVTAVTGSPGQIIRRNRPLPRKGYGTGIFVVTPVPGMVSGPAGIVTVIAPAGSVCAITGSPGRIIRRPLPVPRRGTGHGIFAVASQPGIVNGVPGQITVTGFGGTVQAFTGSPGRIITRRLPVPRRGYGTGTRGTLSVAVTGVTGSITVTGISGSITAVTGSPGRRIAARTHILPGHGHGTSPAGPASASITVPGVPGIITVNAPAGSIPGSVSVNQTAPGAITVTGAGGTVSGTVTIAGSPGQITCSAPPGTVTGITAVAGPAGQVTVTGTGGFVTNVPPRYLRWDVERGFARQIWRSNVTSGNPGLITVIAPAGTVAGTSPATGTIAVTAPPGTVAANFTAPRYVRWDIRRGFAQETWRSHVTSGNPGLIAVTAPAGTVAVQYYTIGAASSAGRTIKAPGKMPPRRGGNLK